MSDAVNQTSPVNPVEIFHRPFQRDHMAAIVTHHALRLPVVPDYRGYKADRFPQVRHRPPAVRAVLAAATNSANHDPPHPTRPALGALQQQYGFRLYRCEADGLFQQRFIGATRFGSMPQEAVRMSFGAASLIRVASSFDAKPPKTTE